MNRFSERSLLLLLATVQFTHIMDFMILMPLGPQLMRNLFIGPGQFSALVAAYTISSGVIGLLAAPFIDRFDRRNVLLLAYGGFIIGTVSCALSQDFVSLLAARALSGAFGGLSSSMVLAIIGDVVPAERRATGVGVVMTAFSLAAALGVPFGLRLAQLFRWEAPFYFLAGLGLLIWVMALVQLPVLRGHLQNVQRNPARAFLELLRDSNAVRALLFMGTLVFGHFAIIPLLPPYLVGNLGLPEHDLFLVYLTGGVLTVFSAPLIGKLADTLGRVRVLGWLIAIACAVTLAIANIQHSPVWVILALAGLFFIFASGRFIPGQAIMTLAVPASRRGAFMSLTGCARDIASGVSCSLAGWVVVQTPSGGLLHYNWLGWLAVAGAIGSYWLARRVRVNEEEPRVVDEVRTGWRVEVTSNRAKLNQGLTALVVALTLASSSARAGVLTVGPDYKSPTNSFPADYKAAELGSWKEGQPLDQVPKGNWWEVFNDSELIRLEGEAVAANQSLKIAVARLNQARATARVARSELLPSLSLNPSWVRQRFSPNMEPSFGNITANSFSVPLDFSYEIDLWGRVRRGFESARADAQASLADYYNVLLTLQSDVAQNYFGLRALDAEIATVIQTVDLRKEQVKLVRSRFEGGIGNELDIARAETELATTEAEAASLAQRRSELENALAILAGSNPAVFRLSTNTSTNWNPVPPAIPAGLPAALLERRPDVAQAERLLASANARIGVAKAAFFPVVSLTASGGYLSGELENLFNWDSRVWSIGPSVSLPIFAGGRNLANYHRSQAAFEEAVARYRQQVLVAFGDVENSLSGIRHLADQSAAQQRAVVNARRAADLATQRYRSGIVSYVEVIDANRDALQTERANAQLAGQRLITTVQLIKALGGGWNSEQLFAKAAAKTKAPRAGKH
ncbi:MAG TPA: efflux transporter outer membrane subunit [Candidatus Limnocylindrales bacterium]|nr:efflux transporter outer membrane subunit [Candidatus Limnocylindrales bacterium]